MEKRLACLLVVSSWLVVFCQAGLQTQYQFRRPVQMNAQNRNFVPNRLIPQKAPAYFAQLARKQLLGDNRNHIPNRFDIPATIIRNKPASPGCTGPPPCGMPAALPPPPPPAPAAYTGFPAAPNPYQQEPQASYGAQGYPGAPPMTPQGYAPVDANFLTEQTAAAMTAKAKLLGMKPGKKFVPHLPPPKGRHQPGKPPFNPPPPPPPEVPGLGQAGSMQPLGYGQPDMFAPQAPAFGQPGLAPPPAAGYQPGSFGGAQAFTAPAPVAQPRPQTPYAPPQPQQAGYNQAPPPLGAPQHDEPQPMSFAAPQGSFSPDMSQVAPFGDPGQQMPPAGSFDLAKKRMLAWKAKWQTKRFGIPRPVVKSRLVPKPIWQRRN